jgi:hypothetical protein
MVRGTAGYRRDYWTAIGGSDRLFYYCTWTENIRLLKKPVVRECSKRLLNDG